MTLHESTEIDDFEDKFFIKYSTVCEAAIRVSHDELMISGLSLR
jgi:hypothetical protein